MIRINHSGFLVPFCLAFILLSQLKPDILSQSKDKSVNWPAPKFEHITAKDGLPNNSINCVFQDHLGYLWFGTAMGLTRFDGYSMTTYLPETGVPSNTSLDKIFEDDSGVLLVGATSIGVLYEFDRKTEKFKNFLDYKGNSLDKKMKFNVQIYRDWKGDLWCGAGDGLSLLDRQNHTFRIFPYQDSVYTRATYNNLLSRVNTGNVIAEILRVGDNADVTKTFVLKKKTKVIVSIMGELVLDYGWIENGRGETIVKYNYNESVYAGGAGKNRVQIIQTVLNAGDYRLHYVSDYGHSYDNWNATPPDFPELWGITILSDDDKKIKLTKEIADVPFLFNSIIGDNSRDLLYILASQGGLITFNINTGKFKKRPVKINTIDDLNGGVVYKAGDGTFWIGSEKGLEHLNAVTEKAQLYQLVKSTSYVKDNNFNLDGSGGVSELAGFIWCGNGKGNLVCFNPQTEQFHLYGNNPDDPESLGPSSPSGIHPVLIDKSGIMWVVRANFGLDKWDRFKKKFNSYKYSLDQRKRMGNDQVMSMTEDNSAQIWIGMYGGGIIKYDRKDSSFDVFTNSPNNINTLSDNYIQTVCRDPVEKDILWIGTRNGGLNKFNTDTNKFKCYLNDPTDTASLSSNDIISVLPDGEDNIWIGTSRQGLNKFSRKTGKFKRFRFDPKDSTSISSDDILCCYKDRSGVLWVGTVNSFKNMGLNKFDPESEKFKSYSTSETGSFPGYVFSMYEDREGNFWVGDAMSGLYLFDRKKEKFILHLTRDDGLSNNTITSILGDSKGNIWLGTFNGLSKFDPITKTFRNYYEEDGLNGNKFWTGFKSRTGEMYFGGENGFTWFDPDNVVDDPFPAQVVISGLSLFNHPGEKLNIDGFIPDMKEVKLAYDQNDLRFDYVGIHYGNPSKNRYKYMLEGFDRNWVDAGTQRNAIYTNLSAGEYVFKVKACNSDGVWNEQGASLGIIIPHPFWATWWAYLLYIIFGMYVLNILRKYELNRVNLKNQVKLDEVKLREREETDRMKSRFFANISHEFRTPLTLISGPIEKIMTQNPDEETLRQGGMIKRNASRLLGLINQLLDLSKLEAGKMKLKASKGNIVSFVKGMTMSFESIAERNDISLKMKSNLDDIEAYFDREMMTKILTNLLSNAFKFTKEGGCITVTIGEVPDESVQISVRDTGIGISEEELPKLFDRFYQVDSSQTREYEGSGLGLALTKELVELHSGKINVKSRSGEGSEFIVELPLGRRHLKEDEIIEPEEAVKLEIPEVKLSENIYTAGTRELDEKDIDKTIILVVEDNSDVREYIKDSLGENYKVEEAINGEQGLRKAEQIIPDLIICDIMMPKMDGNELTKRIKNDEKTSHIPVILLTAKSEQESRLKGLETGADDYLIKPFDTKELLIRIKNLINIRRKLQEKYGRGDYIPAKRKEGEKKLSGLEEQFMCKVTEVIEQHFTEEEFSIEQFGKEAGMSRAQLHRKLKALTGKSASLYLRSVRLMKAKKMIEERTSNISEIAYSVGFSSPQYFTHCFKEEFGYPPSDLIK